MSDLAGNLGPFGLRQVLSFLADARVTGELRVLSGDVVGRVLFQDGSIGYATTATGEDTVQELDSLLERYREGGSAAPSSNGGETPASLEDVMSEQLTEVLFHLTQLESGSFSLDQSVDLSGATVESFLVDDLLHEVDIRVDEWQKIREVVPSNDAEYELAWHIPDGGAKVTLSASIWTLLAAIGGRASVTDVATALEIYEFHAARQIADLVEGGLLEPAGEAAWDSGLEDAEALDGGAEPRDPWDDDTEPEADWSSDVEAIAGPEMPRVEPASDPVTFSKQDLSREEMDEMIRNIGRGIFPD